MLQAPVLRKKTSPDLNSKQKLAIICWGMQYYDHVNERIIDGGMKEITERFSVQKTTK